MTNIQKERHDREAKRRADRAALRIIGGATVTKHRTIHSAKEKNKNKDAANCGVCLVCKKRRLSCVCSGVMSTAAQERFYHG